MAKKSIGKQVRSALLNPAAVLGDFWEFMSCWFMSRTWTSLALLAAPGLILCIAMTVLFIVGASESADATVGRYVVAVQKISDKQAKLKEAAKGDSKPANEQEEKESSEEKSADPDSDEETFLYYRRILQLKKDNPLARYVVARRYDERGAKPRARKMMQELAPSNATGYEKAHEWLAFDGLQNKANSPTEERKLVHHLTVASESKDASPVLQLILAQHIANKKDEGWKEKTVNLLRRASRNSTYLISCSRFAREIENNELADGWAEEAIRYFGAKIKENPEDEESRINVVLGYKEKKEWEVAKKIAGEGVQIADAGKRESLKCRRLYSELCLDEYRITKVDEPGKFQAKLGLLDDAIRVDPWNPGIGSEIALLLQNELAIKQEFQDTLLKQMSEGKANALTYLIVGSLYVKKGNLAKGKETLSLAYTHGPNFPLVINNYAMVLTMIEPPELDKALEIIKRGIQLYPTNHEILDSQGRILMKMGNVDGAIASFDNSIEFAKARDNLDRLDTREARIAAYEKKGLTESAEMDKKMLAQLVQKKLAEDRAKAEKKTTEKK